MQSKILVSTFLAMIALVSTQAQINVSELWNSHATPLGRYYLLTRCSFNVQGGYSCIGCSTALHCYPTNGAIQVECRGLFRYCRNGFCSWSQGEKCYDDNVTQSIPTNVTSDSSLTTHKPLINEDSSSPYADNAAIENNLEIAQETSEVGNTEPAVPYENIPTSENNASTLEGNTNEIISPRLI